jgi:hypothetical protein
MLTVEATGNPPFFAGSKVQFFAACIALLSNNEYPELSWIAAVITLPWGVMLNCRITLPCHPDSLALRG